MSTFLAFDRLLLNCTEFAFVVDNHNNMIMYYDTYHHTKHTRATFYVQCERTPDIVTHIIGDRELFSYKYISFRKQLPLFLKSERNQNIPPR